MELPVRKAVFENLSPEYPGCRIIFDGDLPDALIGDGIPRSLNRGHGIFLGGPYNDLLPPFPASETDPTPIKGHSRDPVILEIGRQFTEATNGGTYAPGKIIFER